MVMHTQPSVRRSAIAAVVGPLLRARVVLGSLVVVRCAAALSGTTNWRCGRGPARTGTRRHLVAFGGTLWPTSASGTPSRRSRQMQYNRSTSAARHSRCPPAVRPEAPAIQSPRNQANLLVIPQGGNGEPGRSSHLADLASEVILVSSCYGVDARTRRRVRCKQFLIHSRHPGSSRLCQAGKRRPERRSGA